MKHPEKYDREKRFKFTKEILRHLKKRGRVRTEYFGRENLPKEGGYVLYSNHQGMFDVVALVTAWDKILCAVYKIELKDVPLVKQIAASTKSYAMDRDDVRQSLTVIQGCTEQLKAGRNVLIFPEGTRSKLGNEMLEFHGGSFRCATKSKCTIVPIALIDCFKVLDQKGSKPLKVGDKLVTSVTSCGECGICRLHPANTNLCDKQGVFGLIGHNDEQPLNGWFAGLDKENREHVRDYVSDHEIANKWMYKKLIDLAMRCCADTCIIPMQDWLGLDNTARMNTPGTVDINWSWRLLPGQITDELGEEMLKVTKRYARANWDALNALEKAEEEEETEEAAE